MNDKRIVIYCSASYTIDPKFNEAARQMVRALCKKGYAEKISKGHFRKLVSKIE